MKTDFTTYEEARAYAQDRANVMGQSFGIEKTEAKTVARMIPNDKSKRFGWELLCEPVEPERFVEKVGGR